ncbi:hypothetical protein CCZ01_09895, partial [Helicobacter monodelphidis]
LLRESRDFKGEGEFNAQVAGAFYKEGLGDIDLVWGNEKMGLRHILERRSSQWGEEKALKFVNDLDSIIQDSKVKSGHNNTIELITPKHTIIVANRNDRTFVISGFRDSSNKNKLKSLDNQPTGHEANFTSESVFEHKASNVLPQNQQPNYTTNLINNVDFTAKYAKLKEQLFTEVRQSFENEIKQSAEMSEFYLQRLLNS